MNQAPTLEQNYQEKIKNLEEKIIFYENENKLQKEYIQSLKEQIELLKEKITNLEKNNNNSFPKSQINTIKPMEQLSSNSDFIFSEKDLFILWQNINLTA